VERQAAHEREPCRHRGADHGFERVGSSLAAVEPDEARERIDLGGEAAVAGEQLPVRPPQHGRLPLREEARVVACPGRLLAERDAEGRLVPAFARVEAEERRPLGSGQRGLRLDREEDTPGPEHQAGLSRMRAAVSACTRWPGSGSNGSPVR
jgi:hypothetical protein